MSDEKTRNETRLEDLSPDQLDRLVRRLRRRSSAAPPLGPRDRSRGPAPLSFAQERLWFLDRLEPGSAVYNLAAAVGLRGRLSVPALVAALDRLVSRHEVLRSRFPAAGGVPVQVVDEDAALALSRVDLRSLPAPRRRREAARLASEEARRPFDLAHGPLLRAHLLAEEEGKHTLVLVLHHAVADGASLAPLVAEIADGYGAAVEDRPARRPSPPIQFADYADWQRRHLQGEVLERELAYWRRQLAGSPGEIALPRDRPRTPEPTWRGGRRPVRLERSVTAALERLGSAHRASPFVVLLAVFAAALHRSAGEVDVAVASPVANRTRREVEDLVGFFANTLVLRARLDDDPPFAVLVERLRDVTADATGHQELPFSRLVAELEPERDPSRAPLAQVMLTVEAALPEAVLPGLDRAEVEELDTGSAKLDLYLRLGLRDGRMEGWLEYAVDLFDGTTAERLVRGFSRLAGAAAASPDTPVSRLSYLSPAERWQLVGEWNDTGPAPAPRSLHGRFEEQARRRPDAPAVTWRDETWTYGELDRRATRLAQRLRRSGLVPGDRVGVCLERRPELVAALLAVLKAGGAYLPLDPAYPLRRLELMLADGRAATVVTRRSLASSLPEGPRLLLDEDDPGDDPGGDLPVLPPVPAEALAYVIYTSGSTGRPKGVAIRHGSAAARVAWALETYAAADLERVLAATSVCFDLSVFEIFVPLAAGGTVVLAENAVALASMPEAGVTLVNTVPSAMDELVRTGGLPDSVGVVNLAGEALSGALVERVAAAGAGSVYNLYGPSEDTTYSTGLRCRPGSGEPTIGRPLPGTRARVLGPRRQLLPRGATGELYLAGAGLAAGYLGRAAATAERFVPDPWGGPGERLYRTGDLARLRPDGEIEFLGRADHQVKVRGFRIELGEVEAVLQSLPGVREAVAVVRAGVGGDLLVAFLVPAAEGDPPTEADLRRELATRLPAYMVPSRFQVLPALPRTPNGKVDRQALSLREAPQPDGEGDDRTAPRTPTEELLAELWCEVLGRESVGAEDDFFALGGHSLLATRVAARLRDALGVEVPLRRFFTLSRLEDLAAEVDAALGHPRAEAPELAPVPRTPPPPPSFAQERIWFLDQLEQGSVAYHMPGAIRLRGELSPGALERAFHLLASRHETLRSRFPAEEGRPRLVLDSAGEPAPAAGLPWVDLEALAPARRDEAAQRVARQVARAPFDLGRGPLWRAVLVRRHGEDHLLVVNLHHVVADGWSLAIVFRELGEGYRAARTGTAPALPALPIQYPDFAAWQRRWLDGERTAGLVEAWRRRLEGLEPLDLPTDRPRPAVQSLRGGRRHGVLPAALRREVEAWAVRRGTTPFTLLLAVFAALLGRYSGRSDLAVGTPVANRTRVALEGLVGLFANTLVLRLDLGGSPSLEDLAARAAEVTGDAWSHQDLPFEKLVQELAPERSLSHSPLFQVLLALQNVPRTELSLPGLEASVLELDTGTTKFDLGLFVADGTSGEWAVTAEYATDLFDAMSVDRWLEHFRVLLENALATPAQPLAEVPVLPPSELRQVLSLGRGEGAAAAPDVVERFLARASETPAASAVAGLGEDLDYAALERRSARLAHGLAALGIGREDRVALDLPRSPDLVVAVVGVLRAGAACVPLDRSYPLERRRLVLAESGARLVLTDLTDPESTSGAGPGLQCVSLRQLEAEGDGAEVELPVPFPEEPAYLLYTSGSTGVPKGVAMVRGALAHLVEWQLGRSTPGPAGRTLQFSPVGFDVSFQEIFATLGGGGTLVLVEEEVRRDPFALLRHLHAQGVQRLFLPFVALQGLAEAAAAGGPLPPSLRTVVTAGEQLRVGPELRAFFAALDGARLHNQYGPTETHVVSEHVLPPDPERWPSLPPIGRPVDGARLLVLDDRLAPVPRGVPGELCVGGTALARGYADRPSWTAERFVPDPSGDGERLYRTGDWVRWRNDGELDFLGRLDAQLKIRGFRVEPAEVEAVLSAHPGVRDAVVGSWSGPGGTELAAWVVADGEDVEAELRHHLAARLPAFMQPRHLVVLEALPLTASGKVDRRALPDPPAAGDAVSAGAPPTGAAAPRSVTEELVCLVAGELLQVDRLSRDADFFALGGHSLLATRLVARLRDVLGVEVPVRWVFEAPRLAALAERIDAQRRRGRAPVPPVQALDAAEQTLSFGQQRLWFLAEFLAGTAAYHLPAAVELEGVVEPGILAGALAALQRRHPSLRTTFRELPDGRVVQRTDGGTGGVEMPVVDLEALPVSAAERAARQLEGPFARRPFDLVAGPVMRALLLRFTPRRQRLLLCLHHIVADGTSIRVIGEELAALLSPAPALPPPPAVSYGDFAVWQRRWLSGEVLEEQLGFWRRELEAPLPVLDLPTDRPRPAVQSYRGALLDLDLPAAAPAVASLAAHRATPFMVLLTAFATVLHRYTGQSDLVVGTPVDNRRRSEVERVVGLFINTLPLRLRFDPGAGGGALLARVRDAVVGAFDHQDLPFERLVEEVTVERDLSRSPVFEVLMGLQEDPAPRRRAGGLELVTRELDAGAARFDLSLGFSRAADGAVAATASFNRDLFDPSTVVRLGRHLDAALAALAADPARPLADLPLFAPAERHQLLREWNDTADRGDAGDSIHALFARRAAAGPTEVAVEQGERRVSRQELAEQVRRIAARLVREGVGAEVPVGVLVERTPEMPAALLGVLHAGGGYLPLDPAYPAERLALMLEDSGAPVVLVSRRLLDGLPEGLAARVVVVEEVLAEGAPDAAPDAASDSGPPPAEVAAGQLAYLIYTSGSTGRPKGVMVGHGNALNFFAAMDRRLGCDGSDVVMAVTSISFDISVLELLWSLTRGNRVVLRRESPAGAAVGSGERDRPVDFGLFFFASEEGSDAADKYRLLLEASRFADAEGFTSVWTPERHFHSFGGLYPNPAVTGAAVAAVTERLSVRAGSVVLPLQDPLRVAEEWSVVDNLSGGRAGVSFASGWHADDFVLAPDRFEDRHRILVEEIDTVRRLWRGGSVVRRGGTGEDVEVRIHPRPVQEELPVWVTAAGNPETFRQAGRLGAGVLTHLLGQGVEELATKIEVYRQAWREAGHAGEGTVALMLHTFLGDDLEQVRRVVREPFQGYLRNSVGLLRGVARALGNPEDPDEWSEDEMTALLDHAFDRYFETSALFGTPESCRETVRRVAAAGVDEIACLVDFGVGTDAALAALEPLAALRRACRGPASDAEDGAAEPAVTTEMLQRGVTLLQCTPSLAGILAEEADAGPALAGLRRMLVGGEALPPALARTLARQVGGELHNMYGPTETTVWSTTRRLREDAPVTLGSPVRNTRTYVVDRRLEPVPLGVVGELLLGGEGVTRGYRDRPALTAERFVPDPFCGLPGERLYRTGDLVRRRRDGDLDFLGRVDHQVKVSGHRIELGEVEAALADQPGIRESVVTVRDDGGAGPRLVAYVVPRDAAGDAGAAGDGEADDRLLRARLPNGLTVATLDELLANQLYREIFENEAYLRHGLHLDDGACVFDVGANIGFFSLFAHHRARDVRVYSFEPIPTTFEVLQTNARLHGVQGEVFPFGVSSREETAEFTFYPHMAGLSGRYSKPDEDRRLARAAVRQGLEEQAGGDVDLGDAELDAILVERFASERVACRLRPLSDLIDELGVERIDYLKVDVERAEVEVLASIRDDHWPRIRQVGLEVDGVENLDHVRRLLLDRGFEVAVEDLVRVAGDDGMDVYMVYASRDGLVPDDRAVDQAVAPVEKTAPLSAAKLRRELARTLPEYMVPSSFVRLERLPRTPNGKIDRKALPAPQGRQLDGGGDEPFVAPRSQTERRVADLWRELLGVERIGVRQNFFELGGTSLSIARLRTRLRDEMGREVSLVDLFRHSTVEALARHLETAGEEDPPSDDVEEGRRRGRRMKQAFARQRRGNPTTREES